jgi:hypothetical protein
MLYFVIIWCWYLRCNEYVCKVLTYFQSKFRMYQLTHMSYTINFHIWCPIPVKWSTHFTILRKLGKICGSQSGLGVDVDENVRSKNKHNLSQFIVRMSLVKWMMWFETELFWWSFDNNKNTWLRNENILIFVIWIYFVDFSNLAALGSVLIVRYGSVNVW